MYIFKDYQNEKLHLEALVDGILGLRIKNRCTTNKPKKKKNKKAEALLLLELRKRLRVNKLKWINGILVIRQPGGVINFFSSLCHVHAPFSKRHKHYNNLLKSYAKRKNHFKRINATDSPRSSEDTEGIERQYLPSC